MERRRMQELCAWKTSADRKPLLIRGARQVGKTWLMKEFGRQYFENTVYINFDENKRFGNIFRDNIQPERILTLLSAETGIRPEPEKTLIIFDEIQESPRALTSLKYFCEEAPEYAIVAAGSFLGIALHPGTSFPVGKVNTLTLDPLSYPEFLCALGEERFADLLQSGDAEMIGTFKDLYMERLREYYYVGGMPEAVRTFAEAKDFSRVRQVQRDLLDLYQQDFSKHAETALIPRLNQVWQSVPAQLAKENRKFIYGQVREGARAKDFELALQWLQDCGLICKVPCVKKPGLPLAAYAELSVFKVFFLDVGLLGAMSGLPLQAVLEGNRVFTEFKGALTEQYVFQQLHGSHFGEIFYFAEGNSRCEVDFLLSDGERILPLEVKAEENLRAKSLRSYYDKFAPEHCFRTSMSDLREQDWITNIPLYRIGDFPAAFC